MSTGPSIAIKDLARQLLDFESSQRQSSSDEIGLGGAVQVCEKFRVLLSNLMDIAGFVSLLSRALVMAKAQSPSLASVTVGADGTLVGLDQVERDPDMVREAGCMLVAQLLGLLVLFIGEPLTLRLTRDVWPDASMDRTLGMEEKL
jgi:hypothetical protein